MFWQTASVFYPSPQPQPKITNQLFIFIIYSHWSGFGLHLFVFTLSRVRTLWSSSNSTTFHDFFHDLFKFSKTLGLVVSSTEKIKNFPCFRVFLDLKQFNRHKRWCPPQRVPFALFNYSSLSYSVLALSSAVTYLLNETLIFHDFQGPTIKFHDFPGLENDILKFHDFPGFHDWYEPYYLLLKIKFSRKM